MNNVAPCKGCNKEFDYSPGNAGNARQLCNRCRAMFDEQELQKLEEDMVVEGNKYLLTAPKRKSRYAIDDIVLSDQAPTFSSDAERFVFTQELAEFINRNGFFGREEIIAKILMNLDVVYRVMFVRKQTLTTEHMEKHPAFKQVMASVFAVCQPTEQTWT